MTAPGMSMAVDALAVEPRVAVRNREQLWSDGACVVYWMQRAQRAFDNPALDVAIHLGNSLHKPVVVFNSLDLGPRANLRHYRFATQGLAQLADELAARRVALVLRGPSDSVAAFAQEVGPCIVVADENPLREAEMQRRRAAEKLRVPLWTIDADVIVPSRLLQKEQWAARTIRPRLYAQLDRFLVKTAAPRAHVPFQPPRRYTLHSFDPRAVPLEELPINRSTSPVLAFQGGSQQARAQLRRFLRQRLDGYARLRNHPELDGTSQLSPYLRVGHIGPRAVALAVQNADAPEADRAAFLEELIVRRELAVNFVRYNPRYDQLEGCERWALTSLRRHAKDRRYVVPARLLAAAESPDPLWNAAQRQLLTEGWMHGYMRMYWGKRLLEWTRTPEEAFALAISLNDTYELDGGDPNGYAGVAWAIGGKHDRAFAERPIFGKVRYMSPASAAHKLDVRGYVARFAPPTSAAQQQGWLR